MHTSKKIEAVITKAWKKYNPNIIKSNNDGVFVMMDDLTDRFLFYVFQNPMDNKIQVNEISGFRKRWDSINHFEELLNS